MLHHPVYHMNLFDDDNSIWQPNFSDPFVEAFHKSSEPEFLSGCCCCPDFVSLVSSHRVSQVIHASLDDISNC
jgi:hypothetical protein